MEIERKFLMDHFPDLPCLGSFRVEQGYLSLSPEVRIRKKCPVSPEESTPVPNEPASYTLCIKGQGDLVREELEWEISQAEYELLRTMLVRPVLQKLYRRYALGADYIAECSLVDPDSPHAFFYLEVEFASEQQAESFLPPPFFGREITKDPAYKMKNFWARLEAEEKRSSDLT